MVEKEDPKIWEKTQLGLAAPALAPLPAFFHPLLRDPGPQEGEGHEIG